MVASNNEGVLSALLYGIPSQSTIDYFRDKVNYIQGFASNAFGWAKQELQSIFNSTYGNDVLVEARTALEKSANMFRDDFIHMVYLDNYNPNLMVQQFIMEEPEVRKMYSRGLLDGFNGTYNDPEPDEKISMFRENYAKVVDGMVMEVENSYGTEVMLYPHLDGCNTLDFMDRVNMLHNWNVARSFIYKNEDPTTKK